MKNFLKKIKLAFENHMFIFKTIYQSSKLIFIVTILSTITTGLTPTLTTFIFKKIVYFVETNVDHKYCYLIFTIIVNSKLNIIDSLIKFNIINNFICCNIQIINIK